MESEDRETAHSTDNGRPDVNLQANGTEAAEVTTILDRDLVKGLKGTVILTILNFVTDLALDDAQWNVLRFREAAHPDVSLSVDVIEARPAQSSHPQ